MNLASDVPALSAHVGLAGSPTLHQAQQSAAAIRDALAQAFDLTNVTLELEESNEIQALGTRDT